MRLRAESDLWPEQQHTSASKLRIDGGHAAVEIRLPKGPSAAKRRLPHEPRHSTRLAAFKVPVKVAFWPETLPRNANGKIMKSALKQAFVKEQA